MKGDLAIKLAWFLRVEGFPTPDKNFAFDTTRKWQFDLAWPAWKVAVEVHGAVYTHGRRRWEAQGRHLQPEGFKRDRAKMNAAVRAGWRVLEFTADQIEDRPTWDLIRDVLLNDIYSRKGA